MKPGALAKAAAAECLALARPRHTWRRFALIWEETGPRLADTGAVLEGQAIAGHLAGAKELILLAVTLGTEIEERVRRLQYADMAYALMLDEAASRLVEETCGAVQEGLHGEIKGAGLCMGERFSPGYGDFPLEFQAPLLALLDAPRRIGLSRTEKFALTPRKSITAVIGLFEGETRGGKTGCAACPMKSGCAYNKTKDDTK